MRQYMTSQNIQRAAATLLVMLLTTTTITAWAQSDEKKMCVVIHETERTTAFALEDRPVVSFTETDVKLACNDITVLYALDHYLKMTIEEKDIATSVNSTFNGESSMFNITGSTIMATGCKNLAVYAVDGKALASTKADAYGIATLDISQLRVGAYIVVFGNQSFKIYKAK